MYIRTRLALWLILILALTLAGLGISTRLFLGLNLMRVVDANIQQRALSIAPAISQTADLQKKLDHFATPEYPLQVQDSSGHVLASSTNMGNIVLPLSEIKQKVTNDLPVIVTADNTTFLVNLQPIIIDRQKPAYLLIAHPEKTENLALSLLGNLLYLEVIVTLGLAGLLVWLLVRREMRPLESLAAITSKIAAASDHSLRLDTKGPPDEINSLAHTINGMLQSLDQAYQQVQQVNDLQRNFLADVSHELRTPLTIILSSLDLVRKEGAADPDFQASALENIQVEAERMARMVTQLLILARTDTSATIAREPLLVADIMTDVCRQAHPAGSQISLECRGLELLEDAVVEGNQDYLKQLFLILLENAFKYTSDGGKVEVIGALNTDTVTFAVADTGIGIASTDLPKIFDRFYRAENARFRSGMGLGLSIARHIAEQHCGKITVKSEPDQGSRFTVTLPLLNKDAGIAAGLCTLH